MLTSDATEALIQLEDAAPDVLFQSLPGTHSQIWPLLRWPLVQVATQSELGTVPVVRTGTRRQSLSRAAHSFVPNRVNSLRVTKDRDFLFVVDGGRYKQTEGGRDNWLISAFTKVVQSEAVVLQDQPIERTGEPSSLPTFKNTFTFADAMSRIEIATKIRPLSSTSREFAREVIRETFRQYPGEVTQTQRADVERKMLYRLGRIRHLNREFERVLDRVQPKVVFMEGASYGSRSSLIKILHDRGVSVAELQHGWIGRTHAAYNFGSAMSSADLIRHLPDFLLTFGEFWGENLRYPTQIVPIGKPHIEAMASAVFSARKKKEVLVVSSVYESDQLVRLVLSLRDGLPQDWVVRLRPHPSERHIKDIRFKGLLNQPRVEFDEATDVYDSLRDASAVFGYASTVLYEALALGGTVFVIDSPLADLYVAQDTFGDRVDADQSMAGPISRILQRESNSDGGRDSWGRFWKVDSVRNFEEFVGRFYAN